MEQCARKRHNRDVEVSVERFAHVMNADFKHLLRLDHALPSHLADVVRAPNVLKWIAYQLAHLSVWIDEDAVEAVSTRVLASVKVSEEVAPRGLCVRNENFVKVEIEDEF